MKRWRARLIFMTGFLVIGAASLALNGCSSSDGGSDAPPSSGNTQIQSADEGGAAAGAGTAGATAGTGLSDVASSLGSVGGSSLGLSLPGKPMNPLTAKDPKLVKMVGAAQKVAKSKAISKAASHFKAARAKSKAALTAIAVSDSGACTDGGTYSFTGTIDDETGAFDFDMTLSLCQEDGDVSDGVMNISGFFTYDVVTEIGTVTFNMTLGDSTSDLVVQSFEDATYAVLVGVFSTNMAMTESYTFDSDLATPDAMTLLANGSATFEDDTVLPPQTYSMTMSSFSDTSTFAYDAVTGIFAFDDTLNGGISQSWTETDGAHGVAVGFSSFNTQIEIGAVLAAPTALSHDPDGSIDISFDGTVSVDFTPNPGEAGADCEAEGTFTFVTDTPIHQGVSDSCPVSGQITINGNTVVVFNSDGSVDVTVGTDTTHYNSCNDLENVCEVQDFEDDPATETEVSQGGSATTSGNTLIANLSWAPSGADSGVIMDLHVNFYDTASPTASTTGTWYIDWHNRDVAGVLPDNADETGNLEYYYIGQGASEATDFDRLVIDGLPQGYYVISVNSWALGTATSVTADTTLNIGGNVFSFPSCTFTTADGEFQTPAAWCRVADMRVNADGTVDILPPNTSLEPWHDGAFGVAKPALSKPRGAGR